MLETHRPLCALVQHLTQTPRKWIINNINRYQFAGGEYSWYKGLRSILANQCTDISCIRNLKEISKTFAYLGGFVIRRVCYAES